MSVRRPPRQILPVDRAIVQRINTLLNESARMYRGDISRTEILREAWSVAQQYRERTGAADAISVSVEHYLYARWRSAEGLYGQIEQTVCIALYPFKALFQFRAGQHVPSQYEFMHTYWESRGIDDGAYDRSRMTQPIENITL